MTDVVKLLQELVAIPSPNPPGDTRAIAEFVAAVMQREGCATQIFSPDARAASVIATLGAGDGPTILLHAHCDTVPLGQNARWRSAPFGAEIRDGSVYGLGAVDDKAALAAMMAVMQELARERRNMRGKLILVAAADEETGGTLGTQWLVEQGHIPRVDFVIVGEQTHNQVALAHKGVVRATIQTFGQSAHATEPARGVNAIVQMALVVQALDAYHRELQTRRHALVGSPSLNVGTIRGGVTSNVVPDACEIKIDRRTIPGEGPEVVVNELAALLAQLSTTHPALRYRMSDIKISNSFDAAGDEAFTQKFVETVRALGVVPGPVGYLPGSDAKHLKRIAGSGIVVFGPGTFQVAHSADEHVAIDELRLTQMILQKFTSQILLEVS